MYNRFIWIWLVCLLPLISADNLRKQKPIIISTTQTTKNSSLARNVYITQQSHNSHSTRFDGLKYYSVLLLQLQANFDFMAIFFLRHHNIVINKTKTIKHNGQVETVQQHLIEHQQKLANVLPMKQYQLGNLPLYHAYYHQHMHNGNKTKFDTIRNRGSIQKRTTADEKKQISTNITMVLEDLLK